MLTVCHGVVCPPQVYRGWLDRYHRMMMSESFLILIIMRAEQRSWRLLISEQSADIKLSS